MLQTEQQADQSLEDQLAQEHWRPSCVKVDRGYLQLIAALLSVCQELDDEGYSCPKVLAKAPAHRSAAPCSHISVLHPPCHVQQ